MRLKEIEKFWQYISRVLNEPTLCGFFVFLSAKISANLTFFISGVMI